MFGSTSSGLMMISSSLNVTVRRFRFVLLALFEIDIMALNLCLLFRHDKYVPSLNCCHRLCPALRFAYYVLYCIRLSSISRTIWKCFRVSTDNKMKLKTFVGSYIKLSLTFWQTKQCTFSRFVHRYIFHDGSRSNCWSFSYCVIPTKKIRDKITQEHTAGVEANFNLVEAPK